MRTLLLIALLGISTNFAVAECTDFMQAFNKHQLVIKGMMDLNYQGKMNADVGDAIGKRLKVGQEQMDAGEFQEACNTYDSILDDYEFDKSFGETPATKENDSTESNSSGSSNSATGSATAAESSAEAAPKSGSSQPAND